MDSRVLAEGARLLEEIELAEQRRALTPPGLNVERCDANIRVSNARYRYDAWARRHAEALLREVEELRDLRARALSILATWADRERDDMSSLHADAIAFVREAAGEAVRT